MSCASRLDLSRRILNSSQERFVKICCSCGQAAATIKDGGPPGRGGSSAASGSGGAGGGDGLDVRCKTNEDCQRFDFGLCASGVCDSPGFRCARAAGLNGEADAGGQSVAGALNSWLVVAGMTVDAYCTHLDRCGAKGGGTPCYEVGYHVVDGTCCAHALSLFMQREEGLRACADAGSLACGATFDEFCPALAGEPFEKICMGSAAAK